MIDSERLSLIRNANDHLTAALRALDDAGLTLLGAQLAMVADSIGEMLDVVAR